MRANKPLNCFKKKAPNIIEGEIILYRVDYYCLSAGFVSAAAAGFLQHFGNFL